ncbi:protein of unknown function [Xenorhabdus poinarii G6]|uniref:Uncharacterized protein n=1 Tax=Xenorhabdus poinarii G6 TaxID=1354304 RepID=A0A068R3Y6_9GAMM|nr:protein of unknown function [Xenorhabdus poinarii G6]
MDGLTQTDVTFITTKRHKMRTHMLVYLYNIVLLKAFHHQDNE